MDPESDQIRRSIAGNLDRVMTRMARAAERSGRRPEAVCLVAVSKTFPAGVVQAAVDAGVRVLGENRVQEAAEKAPRVSGDVSWHLVGHLQRNKAKAAAGLFDLIHSVDSLRLAQEIARHAAGARRPVACLIQVNTSREASKSGVEPGRALDLAVQIAGVEGITIRGLMTIATLTEDEREIRRCYGLLRDLRERIAAARIPGLVADHLSMGMTADFEAAIEEGATIVRVGTAIFGRRGPA